MSDYLSDLVTKNIETADIIQPRRAARFEPTQTKGAFEAQSEFLLEQSESFESERTSEPILPARPRRKLDVKLNKKDADERIASPFSPLETHSPQIERNNARVTLSPKIIEAIIEPTSQNLSVPKHSSPTLVTPTQSSLKSAENREKSNNKIEYAPIQTHHESSAETERSPVPTTKNSEQQSIEGFASIVVKPRVEKVENRTEEATNLQTIIQLPREQSSNQVSKRAGITETPMINITIGRVEIRAAVSSAPSKENRAKPQTLTLDEYLQKRNNGGER